MYNMIPLGARGHIPQENVERDALKLTLSSSGQICTSGIATNICSFVHDFVKIKYQVVFHELSLL